MPPLAARLNSIRRAFFGVSALYAVGIPLALLVNILLARTLSLSDFGVYSFVISLATVLAIPVVAGLPLLLTREIARFVQARDWPAYRGILQSGYLWVGCFTLIVGLATFAVGLGDRHLMLWVPVLLVPLMGLKALRNGVLKGLGYPALAEMHEQVIQPVILLVGFAVLAVQGGLTSDSALLWYLTANAIVFGIASLILMRRHPRQIAQAQPRFDDLGRWGRALIPFALIGGLGVVTGQIVILLLGAIGQTEAIASFRVAERGAMLILIPLAVVNSVIGPPIAQTVQAGETTALKSLTQHSARLTLVASLPIFVILLILGKPLITLTFGPTYADLSYLPMAVLCVANILSIALGSPGIVLAMSGHERLSLMAQFVGLLCLVAVTLALIHPYGALGGAIGATIGIIVTKFALACVTRRVVGIWPGIL